MNTREVPCASHTRCRHGGLALLILLANLVMALPARAWGPLGHHIISYHSISQLPEPLRTFYVLHRDPVVCYTVVPDTWWGNGQLAEAMPEGVRNPEGIHDHREIFHHVLNSDAPPYQWGKDRIIKVGGHGSAPEALVRDIFQEYTRAHTAEATRWFRGVTRTDMLDPPVPTVASSWFQHSGTLPWIIRDRQRDLVMAFRERDWPRALFTTSLLSHYLGDAHVPLHTITDYDGRGHENPLVAGIHSRWESGLVHLDAENIQLGLIADIASSPTLRKASEEVVVTTIGKALAESIALGPRVLSTDDRILRELHPVRVNSFKVGVALTREQRQEIYSDAYFARLHAVFKDIIRARLFLASRRLAAMVLRSWHEAGSPALPRAVVWQPELLEVAFQEQPARVVPWVRPRLLDGPSPAPRLDKLTE